MLLDRQVIGDIECWVAPKNLQGVFARAKQLDRQVIGDTKCWAVPKNLQGVLARVE